MIYGKADFCGTIVVTNKRIKILINPLIKNKNIKELKYYWKSNKESRERK